LDSQDPTEKGHAVTEAFFKGYGTGGDDDRILSIHHIQLPLMIEALNIRF